MERLGKYIVAVLLIGIVGAGSFNYLSGIVNVSSNVNGREMPIYSVETNEKKVAITFDAAGWGEEDVQEILSILEKSHVRASFFVTGNFVETFPELVKAIQAAGHDIGNHGARHRNMEAMTVEEMTEEMMSVHSEVEALTGIQMELFRPPYGDYNDEVILNAKKNGYETVLWSVDSLDWKNYGVKNIQDQVLNNKKLQNGAIILFHTGTQYTAEALPGLLEGLEKQGYTVTPVSELIYKKDFHMDVSGRQIKD